MVKPSRKQIADLVWQIVLTVFSVMFEYGFDRFPYISVALAGLTMGMFLIEILPEGKVTRLKKHIHVIRLIRGFSVVLIFIMMSILVIAPRDKGRIDVGDSTTVEGYVNQIISGDHNVVNNYSGRPRDIVDLDFYWYADANAYLYAFTPNKVYKAIDSSRNDKNVAEFTFIVTNSNDVDARILDVAVETIRYDPIKEVTVACFCGAGDGEEESQIFKGNMRNRPAVEVLSYLGQEDKYDAMLEYAELQRVGTYVTVGSGETEELVGFLEYEPGLYQIVISITYIVGDRKAEYKADELIYFFASCYEDIPHYEQCECCAFTEHLDKIIMQGVPIDNSVYLDMLDSKQNREYVECATLIASTEVFEGDRVLEYVDLMLCDHLIVESDMKGRGEWLQLNFDREAILFGISFYDTYTLTEEESNFYSRPTMIMLEYSDGSCDVLEAPVESMVNDDNWRSVLFERPKRTQYVKIYILDVLQGQSSKVWMGNIHLHK